MLIPALTQMSFNRPVKSKKLGLMLNLTLETHTLNREPYQAGTHIFDEELYQDRYVIEYANTWIDGFKA
jgi:hypothetical protein